MRILSLIAALIMGCGSPDEVVTPAPAPAPGPAPVDVDLAALPGESVYHLDVDLLDQDGASVELSVFAGRPVLVSMFYASCPSACPMLIEDILSLESKLTESERASVRVLLVSLDPTRDTPEVLSSVIERHGLDASRWRLVSPSPGQVRDIAAVLGISYQSIEDGELHHSSLVTLLSPDGRPLQHVEGLRQSPEPLLRALRGG